MKPALQKALLRISANSSRQIKAVNGFAPITDDQLEVMILFLLEKEGQEGMNAKTIAEKLKQNPVRIRGFIKDHPKVLKRAGKGPPTRFFVV